MHVYIFRHRVTKLLEKGIYAVKIYIDRLTSIRLCKIIRLHRNLISFSSYLGLSRG